MKQGWITDYYEDKIHYVNDITHNDNGPAIISSLGSKGWYKHGKHHREDGPAIEWSHGRKEWYYNGVRFSSEEDFINFIKFKAFL